MQRCNLRKGDRSSAGGIVIEGMSDSICDGVEFTFVGARVSCPACNSLGVIGLANHFRIYRISSEERFTTL